MRAIITGVSGYLGVNLVERFANDRFTVIGVDRQPWQPPEYHPNMLIDPGQIVSEFIQEDVVDSKCDWGDADVIVHMAGATKIIDESDEWYKVQQVDTTKKIREAYPDAKLVLISSTAIYALNGTGTPATPYARAKFESEQYADLILRPGTICRKNLRGETMSLADRMIQSALDDQIIHVWRPDTRRYIIDIDEVCIRILNYTNANCKGVYDMFEIYASVLDIGKEIQRHLEGWFDMRGDQKTDIELKITPDNPDDPNPIPLDQQWDTPYMRRPTLGGMKQLNFNMEQLNFNLSSYNLSSFIGILSADYA